MLVNEGFEGFVLLLDSLEARTRSDLAGGRYGGVNLSISDVHMLGVTTISIDSSGDASKVRKDEALAPLTGSENYLYRTPERGPTSPHFAP